MTEFEERADQLDLATISESLADGEIFVHARKKLLSTGAKLLVGPRGTGKTHVMRFAYMQALASPTSPLALYANFSRYLNLEPLLTKSTDAVQRFHAWVIAKLILSAFDRIRDAKGDPKFLSRESEYFDESSLQKLVALLERGNGGDEYEKTGQFLVIDHVHLAIRALATKYERKRTVLLLDDAALSLAGEYLVAFFQIFRLLKTETVAPKASVYPGSTQYGPSFHASHEVEEVPLWLSTDDPNYSKILGEIANNRLAPEQVGQINTDVLEVLKYISFGIPRAFLRLLREYSEDSTGSSQAKMNKIVGRQTALLMDEYTSLSIKLPQFGSLISMGRNLFETAVSDMVTAQSDDGKSRLLILGIRQGPERTPLANRMLKFLIEVGLFYPMHPVSHGPNRKYDRYIPHFAFLYQQGSFRDGNSAWAKGVANYMQRPPAKHPVRRDLAKLLPDDDLDLIKLDLPPCQNCHTARINESQRFCHQCGNELFVSSLFETCMKLPLERIPGISAAIIARVHAATPIRTVGHEYASQNASSDLQQATYVGKIRADEIERKVAQTINEFLS